MSDRKISRNPGLNFCLILYSLSDFRVKVLFYLKKQNQPKPPTVELKGELCNISLKDPEC